MKLTLRVHEPDRDPRVVNAPPLPFTIGRQLTADVVIHDKKISREHLRVSADRGGVRCDDLDSANGFKREGAKLREASLGNGDEIQLGDTKIQFISPGLTRADDTPVAKTPRRIETSAAGAESRPARPLAGTGRRRAANLAVPVVLVVIAIFGGAYWAKNSIVARSAETTRAEEARERVQAFEAKLRDATEIDATIWREGRDLLTDIDLIEFEEKRDPRPSLLAELRRRRELYFRDHTAQFRQSHRALFNGRQFGQILTHLDDFKRGTGLFNTAEREWFDSLHRELHDQLAERVAAYRVRVEADAADHEDAEFRTFLENARRELAGTEHIADIDRRLAELDRPSDAPIADTEKPTVVVKAPTTPTGVPDDILGLLAAPLSEGKFNGRRFTFEGYRGEVNVNEKKQIVVTGPKGDEIINFREIPKVAQLEMALHLKGDALLSAARAGYAWGHPEDADNLVAQYFRDADPSSRQEIVDRLLAKAHGHAAVPTGGYTYSKQHGWEDATTRTTRELLARFADTRQHLTATARAERFDAAYAEVTEWLADESIPEASRTALREGMIAALVDCRNDAVGQLERVTSTPFERLRKAKTELNRRRAAALRMIMDAKIYLPEDHPDWPKGDHVNGQREVDAVVTNVREAWATTEFDFVLPKKIQRLAGRLNQVDSRLDSQEQDLSDDTPMIVTELRRNPGPTITLKNYAIDEFEVTVREFNHKVRAYNAAFVSEDVPEADVKHVIHMSHYREMMGRRRCFIDVRLCRATRKHSEVCDKAGSIWHNGPNGTPDSRARAEGFDAGVGENVAIGYGNPKDIWDRGWYRASDHHRNAVAAQWNCMGYGYYGRVGTQNFASIPAPWDRVESEPGIDPGDDDLPGAPDDSDSDNGDADG